MLKKILLLFIWLLPFIVYAHVGSNEVLLQGNAGPYKLLVSIKPPGVIPGLAKVMLYLQEAGITSITARAVYFRTGTEGSPPGDGMKAVTGKPGQYTSDIWLMNGGSSSIQIAIKGSRGNGSIIVPVVAVTSTTKDLPAFTGYLLAGLGVLLFVLLVTIVSASVSDGVTPGGQAVPQQRKKARLPAAVITVSLISLLLFFGNLWWRSWADDYKEYLFQPTQASSIITKDNELRVTLDTSDNAQRKTLYPYIVPDHGKMMHLFIVRFPAMDAFAHLHPKRMNEATYTTTLPQLPKGRYLTFADVVYVSGFTETIIDTVDITTDVKPVATMQDPDDAYVMALPLDTRQIPAGMDEKNIIACGKPGAGVKLADSSTMFWENMPAEPLDAGKLYDLQYAVYLPDNKPVLLEPYMGMAAHAAVIRDDGKVYVHLHPGGTVSMAAETRFEQRITGLQGEYIYPDPKIFQDSIDLYMQKPAKDSMPMPQMGVAHSNMVSFPYSFPSPGRYRIWVQVKRDHKILTGIFDTTVK